MFTKDDMIELEQEDIRLITLQNQLLEKENVIKELSSHERLNRIHMGQSGHERNQFAVSRYLNQNYQMSQIKANIRNPHIAEINTLEKELDKELRAEELLENTYQHLMQKRQKLCSQIEIFSETRDFQKTQHEFRRGIAEIGGMFDVIKSGARASAMLKSNLPRQDEKIQAELHGIELDNEQAISETDLLRKQVVEYTKSLALEQTKKLNLSINLKLLKCAEKSLRESTLCAGIILLKTSDFGLPQNYVSFTIAERISAMRKQNEEINKQVTQAIVIATRYQSSLSQLVSKKLPFHDCIGNMILQIGSQEIGGLCKNIMSNQERVMNQANEVTCKQIKKTHSKQSVK